MSVMVPVETLLANLRFPVLVTCRNNVPTARAMSIVSLPNGALAFQTDMRSRKMVDLRENENVVLVEGDVTIEGRAVIHGKAFDAENAGFIAAFQKKHPKSFENWTAFPTNGIVMVYPRTLRKWQYEGDEAYVYLYDFESRSWCRFDQKRTDDSFFVPEPL